MPKQLSDFAKEVKDMSNDMPVDVSKEKAKKSADDIQRKLYETEKKTGAPVGSFKEWKALG